MSRGTPLNAGRDLRDNGPMAMTTFFGTLALAALALGCVSPGSNAVSNEQGQPGDDRVAERRRMVDQQIRGRGIKDPDVLAAMERVERHRFMPESVARQAYEDGPLPIGHGQTISQPYIVAYMTEELELRKDHKVLEIGTGSGYQAAVLGEVAGQVFTIEIVEELGKQATALLADLGYENVHVRIGDGYLGWPDEAPFDRIMVTAAPDHVPQPLVDQLAVGGRMIIPVGRDYQELVVITKTETGVVQRATIPVRFVPLTRGKD
jgi:protein-L-isoaspartate(D-aspartate) O-methyltransferase